MVEILPSKSPTITIVVKKRPNYVAILILAIVAFVTLAALLFDLNPQLSLWFIFVIGTIGDFIVVYFTLRLPT
ncbi:MAG TPA: hypothetical protein VEB88_01725 [Candidatus Acidoferrales bacterium]|nr:hypothetical protein [Candidatus Acidoferrales bacterium]